MLVSDGFGVMLQGMAYREAESARYELRLGMACGSLHASLFNQALPSSC